MARQPPAHRPAVEAVDCRRGVGLGPVRGELGDIGGGEQAPAGGTGTAVGGQVRVATLAVRAVRAGDPPGHLPHASC